MIWYKLNVLTRLRLLGLYNVLEGVRGDIEMRNRVKRQSFFIKVTFSYTTMSRKNFKTRKSEYNYN